MSELLAYCTLCPRACGVNRLSGNTGYCRSGFSIKAAKAFLHMWEEPCISGTRGSGAVFFSRCNLHCVFCQNYAISQTDYGKNMSADALAEIFLNLQSQGAHNINLVSPTPYIVQIKNALVIAKAQGLKIPVIYNSNGYDATSALQLLTGLIGIYLPDLKYYEHNLALKYSHAPDYFYFAARAILEMYKQVGSPVFSTGGLIEKGLIIRHLLLPGHSEDTKKILTWIRNNLPGDVYVSIMAQYTPLYQAAQFPELNTKITVKEYEEVIDYFFELGLENGYVQDYTSARQKYVPTFNLSGLK